MENLPVINLTPEFLSFVIATLLSMAITYIPQFSLWWDKLEYKRTIIALAGLIASFIIAFLGYSEIIITDLPVPFFWSGFWSAIRVWLVFVGVAQLTYTAKMDLVDTVLGQ